MSNNNKPRKLTIEQVRQSKGNEGRSEKEALEIIDGLYRLSLVTYDIFKKEES